MLLGIGIGVAVGRAERLTIDKSGSRESDSRSLMSSSDPLIIRRTCGNPSGK